MFYLLLFLFANPASLVLSNITNDGLPNFIIMLMDDMGWGDLGINGEPSHETPNIDKLAREGLTVPAMYTAAAICSPSRASLLTGRLPVRNGFYSNNTEGRNAYTPQNIMGGISTYEKLLPELLQEKDYTNVLIGKWHLGHRDEYLPRKHGFHYYFGAPNCHFGPYNDKTMPNIPVFRNDSMVGRYYEDFKIQHGESAITRILTKEAVNFLSSSTAHQKPFFMLWTPDSSHAPTYAASSYIGRSRRGNYGSAVMDLDAGVGEIINALKMNGLDNNTLVVFTSDNGAALVSKLDGGSNGPFLCGKQTTFEGGFRVPGIFWWPGRVPAGTVTHQVWSQMDLFSTLLHLASIPSPNDRIIDGWYLSQNLFNPHLSVPRNIFYYRGDRLMAVRRGQYKMHLWTWNTTPEELLRGIDYCPGQRLDGITTSIPADHTDTPVLFNIEADPGEKYPLKTYTQEYKEAVALLKQEVAHHQEELIFGEPQLNWCDDAVMHWSPPGCEKLNKCLPVPPSHPQLCDWPH